jgi:signal transduction histidine kinase
MYRRPLQVAEAAVPVLVAAVIVVGELLSGENHQDSAMILGIAAAGTLWGRRRFPAATLIASATLVAVLFHLDPAAAGVALFAPAVALYSLALWRGRRTQLLAGAAAVGAVIAADVAHGGPTIVQTLSHVLLVAIPVLAAEAIRTHRSYLQVLEERIELAERTSEQEAQQRTEQERLRIARELHDLVAHTLTEINVQAGAAAEQLESGMARTALERIEGASHHAIGELRAVLGVLRGHGQTSAPLLPAPGIMDIRELVHRAGETGMDVRLRMEGDQPSRLSDATSLGAYRIIQESLTNARRHAPGAPVTVEVTFGAERMSILVQNLIAGPGQQDGAAQGVGLRGMAERATAVGGTLTAGRTPEGFTVHASLPYVPAP